MSKLPEFREDDPKRPADASGRVDSAQTGVEFCAGRQRKFAIRLNGDDSTSEELPED